MLYHIGFWEKNCVLKTKHISNNAHKEVIQWNFDTTDSRWTDFCFEQFSVAKPHKADSWTKDKEKFL